MPFGESIFKSNCENNFKRKSKNIFENNSKSQPKKNVLRKIRCGGTVIKVVDTFAGSHPVRVLTVNGAIESAIFREERYKDELVFNYMRCMEWAFRQNPDIRDTLLIGGGAFSYPRHYLRYHPDASIDVAEISPEIISIAEQYFGLNELSSACPGRLRIFREDGYRVLSSSEKCYDLIINDAFTGHEADSSLTTDNALEMIRSRLNPGGLYLINIPTALAGPFARRGNRALEKIRKYFEYTMLMPVHEEKKAWEVQNCVLFASEREFRWFE